MAKSRPPPRSLEIYSPLRTLFQILAIQASYYIAFLLLTTFTSIVAGLRWSLDYVFDWRAIRADNTLGWTWGFVWCLCGLVIVISITLLVSRSKLVLDFALTAHFLHLLLVSFYSHSLPRSLEWWATLLVSSIGTVLLAGWTCRRRELRPIPFSGLEGARARGVREVAGGQGQGQGQGSEGVEMVGLMEEGRRVD